MTFEPALGQLLTGDSEDMNLAVLDVIEDSKIADPKTVLWTSETAEPLDSASARAGGQMAKMYLKLLPELSPQTRRKGTKIPDGLRREE